MSSLRLEGLDKSFGQQKVLNDIDLEVAAGELVSLLGASGCGKTTLLRSVAGLVRPDAGRVHLGTRCLSDATAGNWTPPEDRGIGMVFQSYAVWPHMNVLENVAYPLRVRGLGRTERRERARKFLNMVGLTEFESRKPAQLSGGQQQRVALARGLAMEPELLLLDEPLSNLDAKLRIRMRREIRDLQRSAGFMALYVTHDQEEALEISDRLAILDAGRILALGTPAELADHPFLND